MSTTHHILIVDDEPNVRLMLRISIESTVPHSGEAIKHGAIDFLLKPLLPETVRRVVAEVCERGHRSAISPTAPIHQQVGEVTVESQFSLDLMRAKRAVNRRDFVEAEIYLKRALARKNDSAEAHNLMGVLLELRNEYDGSYKAYRAALKADSHCEPAKHNMACYYERLAFGSIKIPVDTGGLEVP